MRKQEKIYIAGHSGLIGNRVVDCLKGRGFINLLTASRADLDLADQYKVRDFFKAQRPDYVILLAAMVGGIKANISKPAQFIYENLAIQNNVIHSAYLYGVKKLLFFGSACSYPRDCPQPIKEEYLLSGYPEPTNEAYAVAKIAGMVMCQSYNRQYKTNFICAIPTNVYGQGDNLDPDDSHVIPALIRRFYEAKINKEPAVKVWGSGNPRRQFIYVDDVAEAAVFLMDNYNDSQIINIATDFDFSIKELVDIVKGIVGYKGEVVFDTSKADGMPRKMLDASRLSGLGWQAKVPLKGGILKTYEWYKNNINGGKI